MPCLRKDFLLEPIQLLEARASGASLILLIVAALDDVSLRSLREGAEALGMHALVEAHTEEETLRAVDSGARIIGINNRDLSTFEVDLQVSEKLSARIPRDIVSVAESGMATSQDLRRMQEAGFAAALVGSALMKAPDPAEALRDMIKGLDP